MSFIKMEIITKISGYDIAEDKQSFQIQNISLSEKGDLKKNTIKVHKSFTKDQLEKLVGKSVLLTDIQEYKKGFKYIYSAKNIKVIENNNIEFNVNKEIEMQVDNVVEIKDDTKLQSLIKNGTRLDLFDIKIKGIKKIELENLKGKKVLIQSVKVAKIEGTGTFYSSTQKPKIIA